MARFKFASTCLATMALMTITSPLHAQSTQQEVNLTFNGTITQDHTTTATVRPGVLPDGTAFTPTFNGGQYNIGDPITLMVRALLPTKAYFDSIGFAPTDGVYKFVAGTNYYTGGSTPGSVFSADINGAIDPVLNAGQPTNNRAGFVLDANTGQYSLAEGLTGGADTVFASGTWDGPSFYFDPATQSFAAAPSSCANATRSSCEIGGDGGFAMAATATNLAINGIGFYTQDPNFAGSYYRSGAYNIAAQGNWSLPIYGSTSGNPGSSGSSGSSGNPTDVPAPSVVFLMAGALAAAGWRNRKRPTR